MSDHKMWDSQYCDTIGMDRAILARQDRTHNNSTGDQAVKLSKQQLADLLAHALNALNDAQQSLSDLGDTKTQGTCHDVIARIPKCILDSCDYRNNGTMNAEDVLMTLKYS